MPAQALPGVDWNEVKTLALAIGCREAARRMGLNENAVKARSLREGWFDERREAAASMTVQGKRKAMEIIAPNAPMRPTAAEVLSGLGPDSKLKGAIALNNGLSHFAQMDPEILCERADKFKALVSTGTPLHGWTEKGEPSVALSFTFHAGSVPPEEVPVTDI